MDQCNKKTTAKDPSAKPEKFKKSKKE